MFFLFAFLFNEWCTTVKPDQTDDNNAVVAVVVGVVGVVGVAAVAAVVVVGDAAVVQKPIV